MLIIDGQGTFVLDKTKWFSNVCEVRVGEALRILSAFEWVHELNLGPLDFELAAKRVVDSFLSPKHDVIKFGILIQNCKAFFRHYFKNPGIEFVQRRANRFLIV